MTITFPKILQKVKIGYTIPEIKKTSEEIQNLKKFFCHFRKVGIYIKK